MIVKREICKVCGNINRIGFSVPDHIWKDVVPEYFISKVVCLDCFLTWADECLLEWEKYTTLYPVSFYTHLKHNGLELTNDDQM